MIKTAIYIFTLTLLFQTTLLKAHDIRDGFKIEIKESEGRTSARYTEISLLSSVSSPKDSSGKNAEAYGIKFYSRAAIDSIEKTIFSGEEIKLLSTFRCIAVFLVSSKGIITEVSFYFPEGNPSVDTQKLAEFSEMIKEKIRFSFLFSREVAVPGYLYQSCLVFKSLSAP